VAPSPHTLAIRQLNDEMRARLPAAAPADKVLLTVGARQLTFAAQIILLHQVREFTAFTPDNDPHGEHDFGALAFWGTRYFWKIDYYDRALQMHSPDPADPAVTSRVLTLMRADEY
jgi:hypothetical protein